MLQGMLNEEWEAWDTAGESVPRAVASVTPGVNPWLEPRSLPLAVLIRCPK
jgi:hypothetical protein